MADLLVVKAKVKDAAKGANCAGDLAEALDKRARELVKDAAMRAQDNGRRTVMSKDIPGCFTCSAKGDVSLVVRSKIKDASQGCNVAGDFADTLNKVLCAEVARAVGRADANNRKTVMSKDL